VDEVALLDQRLQVAHDPIGAGDLEFFAHLPDTRGDPGRPKLGLDVLQDPGLLVGEAITGLRGDLRHWQSPRSG
jgi:hypothetical protein